METKPSSLELIEQELEEKIKILVESYFKKGDAKQKLLIYEFLIFLQEEQINIIDKSIEICYKNNPGVNVADLFEFQDGARSAIKNIIQDLKTLKVAHGFKL